MLWLIVAFLLGGFVGILCMSLMHIAQDCDSDEDRRP